MRDKKFVFGVGISMVWIGAAILMLITQEPPSKINEWGDFIAGFSAPLAFFWLVLGYMQQGEELRHSTEALKLQAQELKNSVEQQSQLVAATREQIKLETDARAEERSIRQAAARPRFVGTNGPAVTSSGVRKYTFKVRNIGATATEVAISYSPGGGNGGQSFASFDGNTEFASEVIYATDADFFLNIAFRDADGIPGEARIPMQISQKTLAIGTAQRVS